MDLELKTINSLLFFIAVKKKYKDMVKGHENFKDSMKEIKHDCD